MAIPTPRSPAVNRLISLVEWAAIVAWFLMVPLTAAALLQQGLSLGWLALLVLPALLLGALIADFASGLGHFLADNFGSVDTPVLGHLFIYRFRQHHEDQTIICKADFRETNGALCLLSLPAVVGGLLVLAGQPSLWAMLAAGVMLAFGILGGMTNQMHRWAHDRQRSPLVRWMQRHGLALNPRHHSVHHARPHHMHFCIALGAMDPLMERFAVWHRLSNGIVALGVEQADDSVMGDARTVERARWSRSSAP